MGRPLRYRRDAKEEEKEGKGKVNKCECSNRDNARQQ